MDAAEYKHVALGLIFLKYISDAFEERRQVLLKEAGADPEDRDEYAGENVFWVPKQARWEFLQKNAKQVTIGKLIDDAMVAIEKENQQLKGVLPKDYARPALDKQRLGELIDLIGTIGLGGEEHRSKDILGRVYEYFLGQFASAEGKKGGEFYTPRCVVRLLVEMIEPYKGRVYDPCCGSSGMFVQSEGFIQAHGGRVNDIAIYGQESNPTTWRLAKMNLALRGIEANLGPHHADTFRNDLHKDLKADFILANPPFNMSDWGGENLKDDVRWKNGVPVQAETREELRDLLKVSSGGVVFTTIQKFFPETKGDTYPTLSTRRNIVVIADEAHRSQYDFIDGFARHMRDALPNASFIGFTGTPIEAGDRSTPAVFGDYIDVYDILRAVEDGATVRIYYEGRLAKLELKEEERPKIDPDFEEATEGEEVERKEKLKSKWARLEAMVGTPNRIALVAKDLVEHFERRLDAMDGKGMIVCMSRRICVDLYNAIVKLRPSWHHDEDDRGIIKVVMTGSAADGEDWQPHIRNKLRREALAKRFKDASDPMKVVIVRDMWLTGFDAPCLHTMYADKPMRSHGLMQAIARVNRVFKDKPGGLVVDYLGLADQLKKAMADYTEAGGKGETTLDQEQAVELMQKNFEIVAAMLHGFDYSKYLTGPAAEKVKVIPNAIEFILEQERLKQDNLKARYMQGTLALSKAFALAVPNEKALAVRDRVGFFQVVRAGLRKHTEDATPAEMLDAAVRQIVSRAVASDEVIDIFAAAGLKTPDISILSDEFLADVRRLPQKNLAMEVLKKLLNDEIKTHSKKNLVQSRSFAEMLERTIHKYQNRSIDAAQVIAELVELAKDMREAHKRGEELHMSEEELAFYDALEVNDAAVKIMGDEILRQIAHELVEIVHRNVTIDWTVKENVRARLRALVKRLLRKYGYPPDKQEKATLTVLEQAELLCKDWAA